MRELTALLSPSWGQRRWGSPPCSQACTPLCPGSSCSTQWKFIARSTHFQSIGIQKLLPAELAVPCVQTAGAKPAFWRGGSSLLVCVHIVQAESHNLDPPLLELLLDLAHLSCTAQVCALETTASAFQTALMTNLWDDRMSKLFWQREVSAAGGDLPSSVVHTGVWSAGWLNRICSVTGVHHWNEQESHRKGIQ